MISKAIKYIIENNTANNPYHNTTHCMYVYQQSQILSNYYDISDEEKKHIGVAALFHDFNHSGGKLKDSENINIAIDGFIDFYGTDNSLYLPYNDILYIQNTIKATEYPHVDMQLNDNVKIIRDSDLIGSVQEGWINVFFNLSKEYNIEPNKFVDMQLKFYNNLKFYTDYANKLKEKNIKDILDTLNKLSYS